MSTTLIHETDLKTFYVQNGEKGSHGNTFWNITLGKDSKAHPRMQIGDAKNRLRAPFGLTTFNEQTNGRQNLDISVEDERIQNFLEIWMHG